MNDAIGKLYKYSTEILCVIDFKNYISINNLSFSRILGWPEKEITSRPFHEFIHPEDRESTMERLESLKHGLVVRSYECRVLTSENDQRRILWAFYPDIEKNSIYATGRDVTAERNRQYLVDIALEASPNGMLMVDDAGIIIMANREVESLFGYEKDELLDQPIELLIPNAKRETHSDYISSYFNTPTTQRSEMEQFFSGLKKGGTEVSIEFGLTPITLSQGDFVIVSVTDKTEVQQIKENMHSQTKRLKEKAKVLEEQALTDGLTGVSNRRAFSDALKRELLKAERYGRWISLIMMDIDHFKNFNDAFGHQEGDDVLIIAAEFLIRESRGSDIVSRYGGEEFAIILPETDENGSEKAAERMRRAFENYNWEKRGITASFGVTSVNFSKKCSLDSDDLSRSFIEEADKALYMAKHSGRNRVIHSYLMSIGT